MLLLSNSSTHFTMRQNMKKNKGYVPLLIVIVFFAPSCIMIPYDSVFIYLFNNIKTGYKGGSK